MRSNHKICCFIFFLLLVVGVPTAAAQALVPGDIVIADAGVFGLSSGNDGKIIKVNPMTGAQTLITSGGFLIDPWKLAIDTSGQIVVADSISDGGGQIVKVDPLTGTQTLISSGGFFVDPTGIAIAANGDILVADFQFGGSGAVIKVDPVTGAQAVLCSGGLFMDPRDVAITPAGEILVADTDAFGFFGGVIRVDPGAAPPGTCTQTQIFQSSDPDAGPAGITIEPTGDILIADLSAFAQSGGVIRIDPLTGVGTPVSSGGFFVDPEGIALDATGHILIGDQAASAVIRVDPVTGTQAVLASGDFLSHPIGVVVVPGGGTAITVTIDIKPGSFPNTINLGSNGVVPVAILSSATFDATTVNPTTITLAGGSVRLKGNGTPMTSVEDVNVDGRLDLVVQVKTEALQLSDGDTEATLEGQTFDAASIKGIDSVRIVP